MNPTDDEAKAKAIRDKLGNRWWRLNNLYWIEDANGRKVKFRCNWAQRALYDGFWHLNVVLKARQLGLSSFILIFGLDRCLFNDSQVFGIVDKRDDDAKKKLSKIEFTYDHLDDPEDPTTAQLGAAIKAEKRVTLNNRKELGFSNGSKIWAGTGLRGGTVQFLHISELGYISYFFPEKAEEIRSGALNTVHAGNMVVIESTHEGGKHGLFYEMVKLAQESPAQRTPLDWKFHFFPWQGNPEYRLKLVGPINLTAEDRDYFENLEAVGVRLDAEQKHWYSKKAATIRDAMLKEFPSTPDECFNAVVTGAIYGKEISQLRAKGRIVNFEFNRVAPFWSFWDIGQSDYTAIWLVQLVGLDTCFVEYYCRNAEAPAHYVARMQEWEKKFGRPISGHYVPHDADHRGPSGKTYVDLLREAGLNNIKVVPRTPDVWVGINHLRGILPTAYFHAGNCGREWKRDDRIMPSGVACLEGYHTREDSSSGVIRDMPVHDETSHGCDAARTFAEAHLRGLLEGTSFVAKDSRRGGRPVNVLRGPGVRPYSFLKYGPQSIR